MHPGLCLELPDLRGFKRTLSAIGQQSSSERGPSCSASVNSSHITSPLPTENLANPVNFFFFPTFSGASALCTQEQTARLESPFLLPLSHL